MLPSDADTASSSAGSDPAWPPESRHAARKGAWLLALGLTCLLLWAALAPLEEGVPCVGTVVVDTKRKVVQHPTGGVIGQVLVREGDRVQEGQPLLRLDGATVRANHEAVRIRHLDLQAQLARLLAEQARAARVEFPSALRNAAEDPAGAALLHSQQRLFEARHVALQADLMLYDETNRGLETLLASQTETLRSRARQLASLREELLQLRELVKDGYAPLNRQRETERLEAELEAGAAELRGALARARSDILATRQRRQARLYDFQRDVEAQLAEVVRESGVQHERLVAATADLQRIEIRAPASGQVVGLAVQTVGGVVQPGQLLMEIVPLDEPMTLEARIPPHLIDRVKAGLRADVRFTGFPNEPLLVATAEVRSISADLLMPPPATQGPPYYLARLALTREGRVALGARQLQPGMPVELLIKSGERSVLAYMLGPLTRRMAGAMKES